jgi:DNA methylase
LPSKTQTYADLASRQSQNVTESRENWKSFLETAGRLYKYPFDEQLMIHAQRPTAQAVAPIEVWNNLMNRYVKRGSKGIALLDMISGKAKLKYVFDYADTESGRNNARRPFIWQMKPEHEQPVMDTLADNYDINNSDDIGTMLCGIAQNLSARYYDDNSRDIQYSIEGSFLEDYDEYNVEVAFRDAMTVSTAYALMTRCGVDPAEYIEDEDFQPIFDFNSTTAVYALGQAVSTATEEVLRDIELTIKKYERERTIENGRTDLQSERRLSDTGYIADGNNRTARQVRNDENELPETAPTYTVHDISAAGETVPALSGNRDDGEQQTGTDDDRTIETVTSSGQIDRPDGVDGSHEQPEIASGGNTTDGVDLQLKSEITDDEIDAFLMRTTGTENGKYRVYSFFLHDNDTKEKADFLKDEYGWYGTTSAIPGVDSSYLDCSASGMRFRKGDILSPDAEINLSWTNVANCIDRLISANMYMSQQEIDHLPTYERQILGGGIQNFFSNLPDDVQRPIEMDNARRIGNALDNPETLSAIISTMTPIMENTPTTDRYYDIRKTAFDNLTAFSDGMFTLFPQSYIKITLPTEQEQISLFDLIDTPPPDNIQPASDEPQQSAENFHITDTHLGEGGAKTKYGYNVSAIRTLQAIETENRIATPDEQEILSRYVGWGGIAQAFDPDNRQWEREYAELKGLLSPEEYESAKASTLNAHYTSPTVISAMYETLERLGFKDGNILEPACGIGNFFGLLPDSMRNSKLYGVELDSITGRIAQQLYPNADIKVTGFEKIDTPDSFFDVAVGNVPFGSYKVNDARYNKHDFLIHDYFFAKTLDQVRPGGIVAFITSKGTLDKANPEVRKYIAKRAELLGAVRLPNNAFLKNAGTEVTSDIIFLQKRDRLVDIIPDWVHLGQTENGIPVNSYFADNPHMMLGRMANDSGLRMYGSENSATCIPIEGADLAMQLKTALSHIQGQITEVELNDLADEMTVRDSVPADPNVRNFSYAMIDNDVYFRENSRMYPVDMPTTVLDRIKGMIELRDITHKLIQYQLDDYSDEHIRSAQAQLNRVYDDFTSNHGLVNSSANAKAFSADSAYYLLCSLEILNENNELDRKSDMFTKRTIKQNTVVIAVDTAAEALAVSISQKARVDMEYMAELTGFTPEKLAADLQGVIFLNPQTVKYENADEYLSGNVREKLHTARQFAETDPTFQINVSALEQAQPKGLDASEISVRLGATWIDKEYIQQFMYELLQTPVYYRSDIKVNYSDITGEWGISGKTRVAYSDILATATYGTTRANAYKIMEDTLNLRDVRVYDTVHDADGKEKRVLNKKETTLACQRQESVKEKFRDWIFADPERRQNLVEKYNLLFNSTRPREYDGSHIDFAGISPEIKLKPHQTAAIARILYGGNTLLAHEVGAGKTFEMVGAAMESKRLGLCQKSMMAVPNHLTEQMASEFLRLYPSANILVATKKDFETKNRKKFCAKIATGDYDCVIIGHSPLEKIPLSKERQERLLNEQIDELTDGIEELKRSRGERFTIKQMEKTKKSLEVRLEKLTDDSKKDSVVTFEQLGVDRLFVDESHNYKNLFLVTKMRNVAGLSTSEAQKSSDLFMKCRYLDEKTAGKGVIFATGTPVTNSMAELYTVQRYLQYDTLAKNKHTHFDAWASNFGETTTSIELSPEGSGYRARTRFSKFNNLPELMNIFKEVADIKTADTLDLPRPTAHFHTVVAKPTDIQKEMVQKLSERAKAVHDKKVDSHEDNMLCITSDGRKIGLDQRLMNPLLPDDPNSKVNLCAQNIFKIWEETSDKRLTQICFCDFSTPNKDGRFNVYSDIRNKLIAKGVPEHEVAFIHDYNTEAQKKELFAKVRNGNVRVLFGSTFKMGSGTNVQDRLIALHDLDCPWRPADLTQRTGRILRQGNMNPEVNIFRYVTEATFDSYLFQTIEKKQNFISQIMTSKSPVRSCDDVDGDALSYAEIKALCAGNPLIAEKMNLDVEVTKLKMLKADHQSNQYRLQDDLLKSFPVRIETAKANISGFKADMERLEQNTHKSEEGISPMIIGGRSYTDRGEAGAALLEVCGTGKTTESVQIGSYRGFDMFISFDIMNKEFNCSMKGAMTHSTPLGDDSFGNITRINNAFDKIPQRLSSVEAQLDTLYNQQANAQTELGKPFEREHELTEKSARLAELDSSLNMDEKPDMVIMSDDEPETVIAEKADQISVKSKPSLLETLEKSAERSSSMFGGSVERKKTAEVTI